MAVKYNRTDDLDKMFEEFATLPKLEIILPIKTKGRASMMMERKIAPACKTLAGRFEKRLMLF